MDAKLPQTTKLFLARAAQRFLRVMCETLSWAANYLRGLFQWPPSEQQMPLHFELWAAGPSAEKTAKDMWAEAPQLRNAHQASEAHREIQALVDRPQAMPHLQCEVPRGANHQKTTLRVSVSRVRAQARVKASPAARQRMGCRWLGFVWTTLRSHSQIWASSEMPSQGSRLALPQ